MWRIWGLSFLSALLCGHLSLQTWQQQLIFRKIPNRVPKIFTVHNLAEFRAAQEMQDFEDFINLKPGDYTDSTGPRYQVDKVKVFGCQSDY